MLYWRQRPPAQLALLVDRAIAQCLDFASVLGPCWFTRTYPRTAKLLTPRAWQRELVKLRAANHASGVYRPTDYHWLILYEVLRVFSEFHSETSPRGILHEQSTAHEVDFEAILRGFFWDLDFTVPLEELTGFGFLGTDWMGLRDAMGIAAGLPPHPAELEIEEVPEPVWDEEATFESVLRRASWTRSTSPARRVAPSAAVSRRKAAG